ncbi:MAG: hypothetical protein ACE14T_08085 [Syntrophales bacterium]
MDEQKGEQAQKPSTPTEAFPEFSPGGKGAILTAALKFLAWFNLIICIFGSIWIFREFGVRFVSEEDFILSYAEKIVNPAGVALSLAVFLQGIFGCVLLLAIASIVENLIAIRRNLVSKL